MSHAPGYGGMGGARGLLVVGHGTADPTGADETRRIAALVAGLLPDVVVELGFLEVIGPTIGDAIERLAERRCREAVVAPLVLFTAGHARRDIPDAVAAGAARAGIAVRQADALGLHPHIVALSRARREEALAPRAPVPDDAAVLVVIGRGASDPTAHRQLLDFATATQPSPTRLELGFVAAARPTVDEALAAAVSSGGNPVRRVVVQPHLLFRGHVEEQVTAAVDRARRDHPDIEWVQVERLGADPLVAEAVIARAAAVAW